MFLKKYINFTFFNPKLPPIGIGVQEIYHIFFLDHLDVVVFEEKIHDNGGKSRAIGDLSDSGDLINVKVIINGLNLFFVVAMSEKEMLILDILKSLWINILTIKGPATKIISTV